MVKAQVTVTPSEAKRLIARAIVQMPPVRMALEKGKLLFKGGTTVSAIVEELTSNPLRISGRITNQGTKAEYQISAGAHRVLIEGGKLSSLDSDAAMEELVFRMGKNDVLIAGANALDINRTAALMIGHPIGGTATRFIPAIMARGVTTIIAVGWEKLIPVSIYEAAAAAGRETIDLAMGMAVGLVPVRGTVVTETDAVSILAGVKATVIGAGGVLGAEGSTTFVMEGEPEQVKKAWDIVSGVKGARLSATTESLAECEAKSPACAGYCSTGNFRFPRHRACVYREPKLADSIFSIR